MESAYFLKRLFKSSRSNTNCYCSTCPHLRIGFLKISHSAPTIKIAACFRRYSSTLMKDRSIQSMGNHSYLRPMSQKDGTLKRSFLRICSRLSSDTGYMEEKTGGRPCGHWPHRQGLTMGGLKPDEVRVGRRTQRGRWCLRGEKIFAFSLKLALRKVVENEVSDFSGQADLHSYSL